MCRSQKEVPKDQRVRGAGRTTKMGVFAGGDIITGAATVIKAAGTGRDAGMGFDKYLQDGAWWDPNAPQSAETPAAK